MIDVTILLDRSGSMQAIKNDMEGALQAFLDEQKKFDDTVVTYARFDETLETVFTEKPIREIEKIELVPRGSTALNDAACFLIDSTGYRLAAKPEHDLPEKVVFIIITDGEENSSREFKAAQVKERIQHQSEKYGWEFVYYGANVDTIKEATSRGMCSANAVTYSANAAGTKSVANDMNVRMASYRTSSDS